MKTAFKWVGIIGGGLVVLIILILLVAPMFIDVEKFKPVLENKVSEATGRSFTVGDDVRLGLFPLAYIAFSDLKLGNPSGFGEASFVSLKSFEIRLKLLPLLTRNVQIKRFILNEPHIVLIKNKNGSTNWSFSQPATDKPDDSSKIPPVETETGAVGLPVESLEVGEFAIKNGSLTWIDHGAGSQKEVSDLNLNLSNVSFEEAIGVQLSVSVDGQPVSVTGSVGPVGKNFNREAIPLDVNVNTLSRIALAVKGLIEKPTDNPGVNLDVSLAEFSPRSLLSELGHEQAIVTSDPNVLKKMALKARIIADSKQVTVKDAVLDLDDSQLKFDVKIPSFSGPVVRANLELDRMNIDRYLPPAADKKDESTDEKKEENGSAKKTDYEPLRQLDLDARLTAGSITAAKANIQDAEIQVTAKKGVIRIKPFKFRLYEGWLSGSADMNVNQSEPRIRTAIDVDKLQIGPLLRDQMDKDLLEGIAKARLNLSFRGDQAEMIKKTLSGKGLIKLNDGAVKGVDLAGMVRNVKAALKGQPVDNQRPRTDFTELQSPFTLKNGVYQTADTSLVSPFLRVKATGQADLVKETLNFRVEPKVVGTLKGQGDTKKRSGVLVPVDITGSFAEPKYEPDLRAVAAQELEKQIFESDKAKEIFEKEEFKPYEDTAKGLLKGLLD